MIVSILGIISSMTFSPTTSSNSKRSQSPERPRSHKKVRFSSMEKIIPHTNLGEQHPLRILPNMSARPYKPIIKRPTQSDLEIFHKNLWNMVAVAERNLKLNYDWMCDCDDDLLLDDVFRAEERVMRAISNRRSKEDSCRSGIKLKFRIKKSSKRLKKYAMLAKAAR